MKKIGMILVIVICGILGLSIGKAAIKDNSEIGKTFNKIGENIYSTVKDLSSDYTEATVVDSEKIYEVDLKKHIKSFSADIDNSSVSGEYFVVNKTENGYEIFIEGEEEPVYINPDKVIKTQNSNEIKVLETTTKVIRTYTKENKNTLSWKTDIELVIPSSVMIKVK